MEGRPARASTLRSKSDAVSNVKGASQGRVLAQWAGKEPEAAGYWLSANMNHPGFDTMARNYSAAVAGIDSEGALEWARSIQDDAQREAAVLGVARQRLQAGGEGAMQEHWLAGFRRSSADCFTAPSSTVCGRAVASRGSGSAPRACTGC